MKKTIYTSALTITLALVLAACTAQSPETLVAPSASTPGNVETQIANGTKQVAYTTESQAQAYASSGPTVYFFKAAWCPTCNTAQKDLDVNLTKLPAGTTIVQVDYDTETELKGKYAVTYQHTFVQIDKDGKEIAKWNGGGVTEIAQKIIQ